MSDQGTVFILGPNGQISTLQGPRGTTPECPEALFKKNDVVRLRNKKHLYGLPRVGAVAAVIPKGFSPDWAMADLHGKPRPLMCQVGARSVTYIIGFEGIRTPYLFKECDLRPSGLPPAEITIEVAKP